MAAVIIDIAEAVKAALNAASLSQPLTATREYVPVYELTDLDTLRVTVVPRELSATALSRRDDDFRYMIDIGIQQRFEPPLNPADLDARMLLVEEIVDLFRSKRLTGYTAAMCVQVENPPIFSPEHIDQYRTFTSVVRLTFQVVRATT